jgi:hypothetical protein
MPVYPPGQNFAQQEAFAQQQTINREQQRVENNFVLITQFFISASTAVGNFNLFMYAVNTLIIGLNSSIQILNTVGINTGHLIHRVSEAVEAITERIRGAPQQDPNLMAQDQSPAVGQVTRAQEEEFVDANPQRFAPIQGDGVGNVNVQPVIPPTSTNTPSEADDPPPAYTPPPEGFRWHT